MFTPKYLIGFLACWNLKNYSNCVFFVSGVSFPMAAFVLEFVLNSDTFSETSIIIFILWVELTAWGSLL